MKLRKRVEEWCTALDRKAKAIVTIFADGEDFSAIHTAEDRVALLGYTPGSMCGDDPIALSCNPSITYVAKWENIKRSEWGKIDGLIISEDFRNGDVAIVLFA